MSETKTVQKDNSLMLLFLVFLVLKLTEVIDWSWWWITAPLWGMVAILSVICLCAMCIEVCKR